MSPYISVSGVLVNRFNGNYSTSIPVSLGQGLYIVQADGKAAKLLVTSNSSGGASTQSTVVSTSSQPEVANTAQQSKFLTNGSPTPLRAANAAYKQYWRNIDAADMITPVEIANVIQFYIMPDNDIIFSMTDGNTIDLADYHNTSFSTQPTQSQNTVWDMSKFEFFGGSYCWYPFTTYDCPVAGIMHKNGVIIYDFTNEIEKYYDNSQINSNVWVKSVSDELRRISQLYVTSFNGTVPGCSYLNQWGNMVEWALFDQSQYPYLGINSDAFATNGKTNLIPTLIKIDSEGITMSFSTLTGENFSHTFKGWNP